MSEPIWWCETHRKPGLTNWMCDWHRAMFVEYGDETYMPCRMVEGELLLERTLMEDVCGEALAVHDDIGNNWVVACAKSADHGHYHVADIFWPVTAHDQRCLGDPR